MALRTMTASEGKVFAYKDEKGEEIVWICRNCGHVVIGKKILLFLCFVILQASILCNCLFYLNGKSNLKLIERY